MPDTNTLDSGSLDVASIVTKSLADLLPSILTGLSGNITAAVVQGVGAVVKDAVAPVVLHVAGANSTAGAALTLAQQTAEAVQNVKVATDLPAAIGGPLESRVADLEAKGASWESAHPWVMAMASMLGKVFPHELAGLGPIVGLPAQPQTNG